MEEKHKLNSQEKQVSRMIVGVKRQDRRNWKKLSGEGFNYYTPAAVALIAVIWFFGAHMANNFFIFPTLESVVYSVFDSLRDLYVLRNIGITMRRVLTGVLYACLIGFPIGLLMGDSPKLMKAIAPFINSLRQVPIMAWVPLSIVWFGLGDGPTIFMIAFSGVFTLILNTIAGVQDISRDYYHAVRSMGANTWDVIRDVIMPGALPGVITGVRLAISAGWMSVI